MRVEPDRQFTDPLQAELYDAVCDGRPQCGFYLPWVLAAESVLDVGCGTGELLRLARAAGHRGRLCGVDPAAAMLDVARARTDPSRPDVEWVLGDASAAIGPFDLAVMTGHAFQALVPDATIRATLAAVRERLAPAGRFVFETRDPAAREWESWTGEVTHARGPAGEAVTFSSVVDPPAEPGLVSFTSTYTSTRWAAPRTSRSTLRFLDRGELGAFLDAAGFAVEEQYGDWDRSPAGPEIITVARPYLW